MQLDNSKAQTFRACPDKYRERYVVGIDKIRGPDDNDALAFGTRMHELLEEHFLKQKGTPRESYPPAQSEAVELEAQSMLARYCATYPDESFDVVDIERVFKIALPRSEHTYVGKLDGVIRYRQSGQLAILEHKTEKRGGRRNRPESWAARSQVSLYKFAVETLYEEKVAHILLDVLMRQSPKGQEPCAFYRDTLEREPQQVESAINDLIYVADQIEWLERNYDPTRWPQATDKCCDNGWKCDYFDLHVGVPSEQLVKLRYKQADSYLPGL